MVSTKGETVYLIESKRQNIKWFKKLSINKTITWNKTQLQNWQNPENVNLEKSTRNHVLENNKQTKSCWSVWPCIQISLNGTQTAFTENFVPEMISFFMFYKVFPFLFCRLVILLLFIVTSCAFLHTTSQYGRLRLWYIELLESVLYLDSMLWCVLQPTPDPFNL